MITFVATCSTTLYPNLLDFMVPKPAQNISSKALSDLNRKIRLRSVIYKLEKAISQLLLQVTDEYYQAGKVPE